MKVLDKIILCLFSVIILIMSVLTSFVIFGWLPLSDSYVYMSKILSDRINCNILIGINIILILMAIKGIFFESRTKEEKESSDGILLENEDGKLMIAKETLISIVNTTVSGFTSVKDKKAKILLDENNDVSIMITIEVANDAIIKELSNNIQIKVKEAIKKSLDIEVKNLDIKIKDIVTPKEEVKIEE